MITFQHMYEEVQEQVQDDSAASLVLIKRALNQGMKRFGAILNREWRVSEKTFGLVADQQYYQMPEDATRIKTMVVTIGGIAYPLQEVAEDDLWDQLNMYASTQTSTIPELFHVKGNDQFGIYPVPSATVASAGVISYERIMRNMSAADYTTGSIAVTNGSAAVVGTGTTWTAQMVGRTLIVEDAGDQDGIGYKVAAFTDTTHVTLEQTYAGLTGSGKTYRIGETPDIPDEFHESLIDYACFRYYRRRRELQAARDMKATFDEALNQCITDYSSRTSSQYLPPPIRLRSGYYHNRRHLEVT